MERVDTIQNFTSPVKGTGVTIGHRVTSDASGVQAIFGRIGREGASLGYVNYDRNGNRCQIFFEPFTATTTGEKRAIVATALADLDELLTPASDGGE